MYTDYFLAPKANSNLSERLCSYCGEEIKDSEESKFAEKFICSCEGARKEIELKEETKRIELEFSKIQKLSEDRKREIVLSRQIEELQRELVRATIETKTPYDG